MSVGSEDKGWGYEREGGTSDQEEERISRDRWYVM